MGQGIIVNMRVCPGPSLPEPGEYLQLAGAGATKWQDPTTKTYTIGQSRCIEAGDEGSLTGFFQHTRTIFVKDTKFRRSPLRNHQADQQNTTSSTESHTNKIKDIVRKPPRYHFPISAYPPTSGACYF